MHNKHFIILLLCAGFLFRLYFFSWTETRLIHDMETNHTHALTLMEGKIATDCCNKNVEYSMFLAIIYSIFKTTELYPVKILQILMDVSTGFLLYLTAQKINKKSAIPVLILYLFNPLTSAFTGLRLAEILTIWYITLIAYVLTLKKSPLLWLAVGLLLGNLVFVRLQFFYFSVVFIILLVLQNKFRLSVFILLCSGFLLGSAYMPIANYANYGKASFTPPYNWMWGVGLYSNFYRETRKSEIESPLNKTPNLTEWRIFDEYLYADSLETTANLEKKYKALFIEKIRTDWLLFTKHQMQNIIWLWDKNHLSEYIDPYYPANEIPVRIYNFILLVLSVFGFSHYAKRKTLRDPFSLLTFSLFLYITFMFSLVSNESRQTLAFYPLIFLWAGYGISNTFSFKTDQS